MKLLQLNIELSNSDYEKIKKIYTTEELEAHIKKYLKDTIAISSIEAQEKILAECRANMNRLKKLNLKDIK